PTAVITTKAPIINGSNALSSRRWMLNASRTCARRCLAAARRSRWAAFAAALSLVPEAGLGEGLAGMAHRILADHLLRTSLVRDPIIRGRSAGQQASSLLSGRAGRSQLRKVLG